MTKDGKRIFVMGHPEYDRMTLDAEYKRDKSKGLPIELPKNYYPEDNPAKRRVLVDIIVNPVSIKCVGVCPP